ncbi:hypothetical protein ACFX2G_034877 [Malus domestica]
MASFQGGNQLIMQGVEKFSTESKDLISYVSQKIGGIALPRNEIVVVLDFYEHTPEELLARNAESIKQGKLYVFTRVWRKYPGTNSNTAKRTVRDVGVWKSRGKKCKALDITHKKQEIGTKLVLWFFNLRGNGSNDDPKPTNWVMEEYRTRQRSQARDLVYDWVLCKVYQSNIDGNGVAISNNQANQAVEHPIARGDVEQDFGGNNNVDETGTQQNHPHVQTSTVGYMALQQIHESETTSQVQQNNNNDSSVPCKLFSLKRAGEVVAEGTLMSMDLNPLVDGVDFGESDYKVLVSRVVKNEEVYNYPPTSNVCSLKDAIGVPILWPACFVAVCPACTLIDWTSDRQIAVAEAVLVCEDPSTIVNGCPLGQIFRKVTLTRVLSKGRLVRDMPDGVEYLDDALVGRDIVWPVTHISFHGTQ